MILSLLRALCQEHKGSESLVIFIPGGVIELTAKEIFVLSALLDRHAPQNAMID